MKVLMLWAYYPVGLEWLYGQDPTLALQSFEGQQSAALRSRMFGWTANICALMNRLGIQAEFVVTNAEPMQKQWAKEQGVAYDGNNWQSEIALAQVRHFSPDILWIPFLVELIGPFIREARRYVRKVVMWCGSPFTESADVEGIDVLMTENPLTLRAEHHRFEQVLVTKPGFDVSILSDLGNTSKKFDVTFCGQLSPMHGTRRALLAKLLRSGVEVDLFAMVNDVDEKSFLETLRAAVWSLIRAGRVKATLEHLRSAFLPGPEARDWRLLAPQLHQPVFGLEMYRILASSRMTLNIHIDTAQKNAGNMRMFEATGVGSCLITEWADNIEDLFMPDVEIVTYRTGEELGDKVKYLMAHPQLAEDIGRAGQQRVLRDHTLERMWRDISPVFS